MKKALLCCSGGFSSTAVADALDMFAISDGYKWDAMGIAAGGYSNDAFDGYEVVLVSPQIRFRFKEIKAVCDEKGIKTIEIPPNLYIANKAEELWNKVLDLLNK